VPVPVKLARDAAILSKLGRCRVWQFAEAAEVSEATARARLRRLHEHGRARRVHEHHSVGFVYTTAVKA
jgi:DeoR/GlpR family transcriptional regulator of sugar metabolism